MPIGNDLVDLRARDARGKSGDERFLNRVFTEPEKAWIRRSPDPDLILWLCWTAKEAAFKVARKMRPAAVFAHRAYEVRAGGAAAQVPDPGAHAWDPGAGLPGPAGTRAPAVPPALEPTGVSRRWTRGRVEVRGALGPGSVILPVEWEVRGGRIHCLATSVPDGFRSVRCAVDEILPQDGTPAPGLFSERECRSARSPESWAARRVAKRIAAEVGLGPVEVLRREEGGRLGPPRLHAVGAESPLEGWDLSLSHDGRFVAAAVMPVGS